MQVVHEVTKVGMTKNGNKIHNADRQQCSLLKCLAHSQTMYMHKLIVQPLIYLTVSVPVVKIWKL